MAMTACAPAATRRTSRAAAQGGAVSRTRRGQRGRARGWDRGSGEGRVPVEPCRRCQGRGEVGASRELEVQVPAGISDGQRIRVGGQGSAGHAGAPPGDLYVLVGVREDERFVREGAALITALAAPAPLAAPGTEL